MKRIVLAFLFIMAFASQAFAFNPDPVKFEYIGQKKSDGNAIFYEIATAKADGQKGVVVMLQADPKNRVLRYYRNVVIDPVSMTMRGSYCEVRNYKGQVLETFNLPADPIKYEENDLTDKIYQDLRAKGIIQEPKPVYVPIYVPVPKTWQISMSGGSEVIVDLPPAPNNDPIADI